jgi:hypothetical protein
MYTSEMEALRAENERLSRELKAEKNAEKRTYEHHRESTAILADNVILGLQNLQIADEAMVHRYNSFDLANRCLQLEKELYGNRGVLDTQTDTTNLLTKLVREAEDKALLRYLPAEDYQAWLKECAIEIDIAKKVSQGLYTGLGTLRKLV